jgi:fructokinase
VSGERTEPDKTVPPLVVGIGEILWDLLPTGRQMGGAPANFAFHARALGAESFIVSGVGHDELGRELLDELGLRGFDRRFIAVVDAAPTGSVSVDLDGAGVPRYVIREGVAWDALPWGPALRDLARAAEAVCFGTLAQRSEASRRTISAFLKETRPEALRVLDLNLRQAFYSGPLIRSLLERTTILKLNDDELRIIGGMLSLPGSETDILRGLLTAFPMTAIALTKGRAGSRLIGRGQDVRHPGYPVEAVDTVGAGDAFTAALTVGYLKRMSWEDISESAGRLASHVCTRPGAWPDPPLETAVRTEL